MHLPGKILQDSLLKNALYLMMSQVFNLSTGFFFWIIAARYYSASDVGMISALLSAMMLLGSISNLGFDTSIVLFLPSNREKAGKIINSCITVSSLASILFSMIFILELGIWAPSLEPVLGKFEYFVYFLLITCASSLSALISTSLVAGRRSSFQTLKDFSFGLVKIVPLSVFASFGAVGIYLSWGIGVFISIIIGFLLLPKVWNGYQAGIALDPILKKMASVSLGNYFGGIFASLPRMVLPIMIANTISTESAGFYYIAMIVAGLLFGVPQAISSSLMAEASTSGDLWGNVRKGIKFSFLLLIPGVFLFIILGKYILHVFNPIYGENSYMPLILLSVASIPYCVCTIFSAVRNSQKRIKNVLFINTLNAGIILALAYPLMKMFGITGAATAFLIGNILSAAVVILIMSDSKTFIKEQLLVRAN